MATGRLPLIGTSGNVNNLVPTKGDSNGEAKVLARTDQNSQSNWYQDKE